MSQAAFRTSLLTLGLFLLLNLPAAATSYRFTNLGSLGGGSSSAAGINAAGQVVGWSKISGSGPNHAFLYSGGVMHDLYTLPGGYSSQGRAINASAQMAGSAYDSDNHQRAFLYSGGSFQDLGALPDAHESSAFGINASGQVVGQAYLYVSSAYRAHAFRYNGSLPLQDLGSLVGPYGNSYAKGINASGQVVGVSETSTYDHAFLYSGGSMGDLGTLGGGNSVASGINDAGQVAGWSKISDSGPYHAFLYSGAIMHDLDTLGGTNSYAYGINAGGQMVGAAQIISGSLHAFLYTGGSMQDLNSLVKGLPPGVVLSEAVAINDQGLIAANGSDGYAYLLTPAQAIAPGFLLLLSE